MKEDRRTLIKRLISEQRIGTQEELVNLLYDEGYKVTQATVSRDIRELNITKAASESGYSYYKLPIDDAMNKRRFFSILSSCITKVTTTGSMVIVNTTAGTAMAAASSIDEYEWSEILGTIAGDDVIFIATLNEMDADTIASKLEHISEF